MEVASYLEQYEKDPNNLDIISSISCYFRLTGKNNLSYFFAKHGLSIIVNDPIINSKDNNTNNNTNTKIYDNQYYWKFLYDLSIVGYYVNKHDETLKYTDHLVLINKDNAYKENVHSNQFYYLSKLDIIQCRPINITLDPKWHPLNPTIIPYPYIDNDSNIESIKRYMLITRTVNYLRHGNIFDVNHPKNTLITRNFFLNLDSNYNTIRQNEIIENLNRIRYDKPYLGLEDCRMFVFKGKLWFTCTNWDTHPELFARISLCRLNFNIYDDNVNNLNNTINVEFLLKLQPPHYERNEKNWIPFTSSNYPDQILLLYSFNPLIIYSPSLDNGKLTTIVNKDFGLDLSRFRGGSTPILFDNGFLFVIHEAYDREKRYYSHRFVWFDHSFDNVKISLPFYFREKTIEFCSGLSYSHIPNEIILTIGVDDREIYLITVNTDLIRSKLNSGISSSNH